MALEIRPMKRLKTLGFIADGLAGFGWIFVLFAALGVISSVASLMGDSADRSYGTLGLLTSFSGLIASFLVVGMGQLLHAVAYIEENTQKGALALQLLLEGGPDIEGGMESDEAYVASEESEKPDIEEILATHNFNPYGKCKRCGQTFAHAKKYSTTCES